jgi:hypothetical protein
MCSSLGRLVAQLTSQADQKLDIVTTHGRLEGLQWAANQLPLLEMRTMTQRHYISPRFLRSHAPW